jgi:hypothetical protein
MIIAQAKPQKGRDSTERRAGEKRKPHTYVADDDEPEQVGVRVRHRSPILPASGLLRRRFYSRQVCGRRRSRWRRCTCVESCRHPSSRLYFYTNSFVPQKSESGGMTLKARPGPAREIPGINFVRSISNRLVLNGSGKNRFDASMFS